MDMEGEGEEMGSWIWSEGKGIYSEQLGGKGGEGVLYRGVGSSWVVREVGEMRSWIYG